MSTTTDRPQVLVSPGVSFPGIGNDLTRRRFLAGAGGLLLGADCGNRGAASGGETTSATRTIEHKYGSTEISATR